MNEPNFAVYAQASKTGCTAKAWLNASGLFDTEEHRDTFETIPDAVRAISRLTGRIHPRVRVGVFQLPWPDVKSSAGTTVIKPLPLERYSRGPARNVWKPQPEAVE